MAARFFVNGGVDNNWGTTGNWSATSGGAGGETVPGSSDDVTFDASSPNCTINASARAALSLTCTNYTNTLTFSQTLTVAAGNITLGSGMSFAGASALIKSTAGTWTSNGVAVTVPVTFGGNVTHTLADNWDVDGTLTVGGSTTQTINGNTISVGGNLVVNGTNVQGTTAILFDGTGTWSGTGNLIASGGIVINTAGTLTFGADIRCGGSLTYTAGTVVTTGSRLRIANTATTLAINGITLNEFEVGASAGSSVFNSTLTLTEDVNCASFIFDTSTTGTINGNQIHISGGINGSGNGGRLVGTTEFVLEGTGTIQWAGNLNNDLTINTAGTITLSGTLSYNGGTFTYTAGTVLGSSAHIVVQTGTGAVAQTIFDLNGLVLDADLSILRTGATAIRVSLASAFELATGNTVTIVGSASQLAGLDTVTGGVQQDFILPAGAFIDIGYATVTDIDSSGGEEIFMFRGTLSNTVNWTQTPYELPLGGGGSPGGSPAAGGGQRSYVF